MKINERHRQRSTAFTLQEKQHPCIELFFSTPLHIEIFHYVVRPVGGVGGSWKTIKAFGWMLQRSVEQLHKVNNKSEGLHVTGATAQSQSPRG